MAKQDLIQFISASLSFTPKQVAPFENHVQNVFKRARAGEAFHGWVDLPDTQDNLKASAFWARAFQRRPLQQQKDLVVLGIGGSCLGARAVYDALIFTKGLKPVHFIDNVDGYFFENRLAQLDLKKVHFLVISKSGETSETLFQLAHVLSLYQRQRLKAQQHVTVITEAKPSTLRNLAGEYGLATLDVPQNVGGRYSVFSNVGLAPLLWAGIPVRDLLAGARWAKSQTELISRLIAFYAATFGQEKWISVFWCYADGLKTWGLWLEQLWAESLGKAQSRSGGTGQRASTPLSCVGATDQHSLLQQFTEGYSDKSFTFIRCDAAEHSLTIRQPPHELLKLTKGKSVGELLQIEARATQQIIENKGLPAQSILVEDYSAESMGALLYLYEMVVAGLGDWLDVNAFDQPGVEGVKRVTLGTLGDPRYQEHALSTGLE